MNRSEPHSLGGEMAFGPLHTLLTDGFDDEQIWGQLELQVWSLALRCVLHSRSHRGASLRDYSAALLAR